jgi:predicted DNA-binding antitoxin AbrB/MazE fold protein
MLSPFCRSLPVVKDLTAQRKACERGKRYPAQRPPEGNFREPSRAFGYNQVMVRELEAVYENGLLRPLEPLSLVEKQRVHVTITDLPPLEAINHRNAEQDWLAAHEHEYAGKWVALDGDILLSHGPDARAVRDEARRRGVYLPLLVHVPEEPDQPSAFWL